MNKSVMPDAETSDIIIIRESQYGGLKKEQRTLHQIHNLSWRQVGQTEIGTLFGKE